VPAPPAGTHRETFDVDGTTRSAVVVVPERLTAPAPLVLAFHGHGGSGAQLDRSIDLDGRWPQAIVVYPDGLVGHKGRTDAEGVRTGWQILPGDEAGRDLRFYDVLLARLLDELPVDHQRTYLMGHSNGSGFVAMLLHERGDTVAATANMSGQPGRYITTDPVRSMFLMMGETDPLVPYDEQKASIPLAEEHLGANPANATVDGYLRSEPGRGGLELAIYIHPGGHPIPPEVPALVVAFFQRHTLP
jgi:polyhydroxybutyrate depolymerase